MDKNKQQLFDFLKKYGWTEDLILFIDSLPISDDRKKHIFSTLSKLGICTITKEEAEGLLPYITEGYFLILKTKKANFLIATPKTPTTKRDSRYVSIELEKLKQLLNKTPKIPIQLKEIIEGLNLKEDYVSSIALQYYLITNNKKEAEEYFNVSLNI
jgi:hypothetical protein